MRGAVTAEVLAAAVAATDAGLLICDRGQPDAPIVFANEAFSRITGYAREEILGRNCRFLQGPGTDRAAVARLRAAIEAGRPVAVELLNYRKDGRPFWNALRIAPVAEEAGSDGGAPRFLVGVLHDVTGQRRAAESLADEEAVLRAVIDASADGIVVTDVAGRILRANAAAERMFGYAQGGLARLDFGLLVAAAGPGRGAAEGRRRARGTFPTEVTAAAIARRGQRMTVHFVRDLTERERAQAALAESEARFRNMADHAPTVVWVTEAEGYCSYLNPRWYELTGQAPGGGDGRGWLDRVHPDDRAATVRLIDAARAARRPFRVEYRLGHADGTWRWVIDAGAPRYAEDRTFLGYVGSVIDIDERRRAEAALREDEERYRTLVETSPEAVYVLDAGVIVFANRRAASLLGAAVPEDLIGRRSDDLVDPACLPLVRARSARLTEPGARNEPAEVLMRRLDGTPLTVESASSAVAMGGRLAKQVVLRDVGERRRAEAALRELGARLDALASAGIVGITLVEGERVTEANDAFLAMLGYAREDLAAGRLCWPALTGPGEEEAAGGGPGAEGEAMLAAGACRPFERECVARDGRRVPVLLGAVALDPERRRRLWLVQDISERKRAEAALAESEARLRLAQEAAGAGTWELDLATRRVRLSPESLRLHGLPEDHAGELDEAGWAATVHPDDRADALAAVARVIAEGGLYDRTFRVPLPDGPVRWIQGLGRAEHARDGRPLRLVGLNLDVSARRAAEAALRESEAKLRATREHAGVGIGEVDAEGRFLSVNPALCAITGCPADELIGRGFLDITHAEEEAEPEREAYRRLVAGRDRGYTIEKRYRRRDGTERWAVISASAVRDPAGRFLFGVRIVQDIHERRLAEERVRHLAQHDPLTGLPNRALLQDRLQQALLQARRHGDRVGLLLLDLDRFKDTNDTLGHDAGDALLREVARRLAACVRAGDTVARLGGDEFAIVLPRLPSPDAAAAAAAKIGAVLGEPVAHGGAAIRTAASIGIAVFPDDGAEPGHLLKHADLALYKAKAEGEGAYCFFEPDLRRRLERRKGIEHELRLALAGGEIVPFFQPKVRLADGKLIGFEALARWAHPERGIVPPAEFLPVAEETGLIVPLGEAVLQQAVAAVGSWQERHRLAPRFLAVNVAAAQLRRGGFAAVVREVLAESRLAPRQLVVEVTEGVFLGRGTDRVAAELEALHAQGVTVALDDFGTGYASLAHLKRFPVGVLKVDQSFVRDMLADPGDAAIVRAVINLGHSLGMKVTAEGVETPEQADWLRLQGCDHAQGYLFGRPMPAGRVPAVLRRRRRQRGGSGHADAGCQDARA